MAFYIKLLLKCSVAAVTIGLCIPSYSATFGFFNNQEDTLGYKDGKFIGEYGPIISCIHDATQQPGDKVVALPPPRLIEQLADGQADVGYGLGINPDRNEIATPSKPLVYLELWFLSSDSKTTPQELNGKKVATVKNSSFVPMIQQGGGEALELGSYDQAVKMAHSKRADAAMVVSAARQSMDMTLVDELNKTVIAKVPVVAYVSKKSTQSEDLLARLNSAIDNCPE